MFGPLPGFTQLRYAVLRAAFFSFLICLGLIVLQALIWGVLSGGPFVPVLFAIVYAAPYAVLFGGAVWLMAMCIGVALGLLLARALGAAVWPIWMAAFAAVVAGTLALAGLAPYLAPMAGVLPDAFAVMLVAGLNAACGEVAGVLLRRHLT